MSSKFELLVPELGPASAWGDWKLQWKIRVGDSVATEQTVATLANEMVEVDIPCPRGGVVAATHIQEGAFCREGDLLLTLTVSEEVEAGAEGDSPYRESPRLVTLEERVAYQERYISELNDVIVEFTHRVQRLEARLGELEQERASDS